MKSKKKKLSPAESLVCFQIISRLSTESYFGLIVCNNVSMTKELPRSQSSGVRVDRSFVFWVVFWWSLFDLCPFSFDHCVVCPFVLFLLTIVLSVLLSFFFWPLCCLSFISFSFDHCVVCPLFLFLLTIVLSVFLQMTNSDYRLVSSSYLYHKFSRRFGSNESVGEIGEGRAKLDKGYDRGEEYFRWPPCTNLLIYCYFYYSLPFAMLRMSLNNSWFGDYLHRIYLNEHAGKDATDTQKCTSYHDRHLDIDNEGRIKKLYDKRADFMISLSNCQLPLHQ